MIKAGTEPVLSKYPTHEEQERKLNNRMVGMTKAHEKILGRKVTPADVDKFVNKLEKGFKKGGKAKKKHPNW